MGLPVLPGGRGPRGLALTRGLALALTSGLALALSWGAPLRAQTAQNAESAAGAKGAQIYCYMRSNGNVHEVSWIAAYALIKRQNSNLFKTSPEHAAVMITEAVVQNPGNFPDCGRYLGDLYNRRVMFVTPAPAGVSGSAGGSSSTITRSERYGT